MVQKGNVREGKIHAFSNLNCVDNLVPGPSGKDQNDELFLTGIFQELEGNKKVQKQVREIVENSIAGVGV